MSDYEEMIISTERCKVVKKCHWCGRDLFEEDIKEKGNARGYGYYIDCICGKENVIKEVDLCY